MNTERGYMNAMVEARRERDDLLTKMTHMSIEEYEWMDTLARALGIQTGRESWWDTGDKERRAKILERIKRLRRVSTQAR